MFNIKSKIAKVGLALSAMVGTVASQAALGVSEQAVYDSVGTLITDHSAAALVILTAILGAFIGFKLLKKFVGKAT